MSAPPAGLTIGPDIGRYRALRVRDVTGWVYQAIDIDVVRADTGEELAGVLLTPAQAREAAAELLRLADYVERETPFDRRDAIERFGGA